MDLARSHLPPLPPVTLGYTDNRLDRMSHRRSDARWIETAKSVPDARLYLFSGETPILKRRGERGDPLFDFAEASRFGDGAETVFLGLDEGAPRFGRLVPDHLAAELKPDPDFLITDLRSIAILGLVEPAHMGPIAEAKALVYWHSRHRFCSCCGAASLLTQGGWRRDCPSCTAEHFPRTDPVVIMLAVDGDRALLGRQKRFPPGMYSALAGFLEPGETIADAVRREIFEEAGIRTGRVTYLCDQPWPFPASLMIGCLAEAETTAITPDMDELEDARWFSREECWMLLARKHPANLSCPPPVAIAHHLIRAFVEPSQS